MYNFRTDLVDERKDLYKKANKIENEIQGIEAEEEFITDKIKVTRVKVTSKKAEEAIGKKEGNYITIDIKNMNIITDEEVEKTANVLSDEIKKLVESKIGNQDEILIVGLGNEEVTPDALRTKCSKRNRNNKTYYKVFTTIYR